MSLIVDRIRRWRRRRAAYRACFYDDSGQQPSAMGDIVLQDLARFCGAYQSTVKVSPITGQMDPMASAVAQGRREVWLRVLSQLRLPDEAVIRAMENGNE